MSMQDNPLYDQLSALLQKAEMLETINIPESRKSINVNELEISFIMSNLLNNVGIYAIWDLVHMKIDYWRKWRCFNSRPRMSELIDAIDKAIKVLTGEIQLPKHDSEVQA